jgi:hypothetical protein
MPPIEAAVPRVGDAVCDGLPAPGVGVGVDADVEGDGGASVAPSAGAVTGTVGAVGSGV